MGSPTFAVPTLQALIDAGHEIACVYCQPPRPAGRGQQARPVPVQAMAEEQGLPVRCPRGLKSEAERQAFDALDLDAAIVVAYGLILPGPVLDAPRLGCFNVHASLLPRWRGAAPIQRAILAGDRETGVTIMKMDQGLDTGPMLLQRTCPILPDTTAASLHDKLAPLGASALMDALSSLTAGTLVPTPQPADGVTYAHKIERGEGRLDWHQPAGALERAIRAFTPWPGAWFETAGERIKVLAADAIIDGPSAATPGTVLDDALSVACAEGALRLTRLQRSGRAALDGPAFLRGFSLPAGRRLD